MSGVVAAAKSAAEKRAHFRAALESGELQRFPGAFSPLVAKLVAEIGFDGIYVSGAVLSADLGLPDIGLTTLTEVCGRGGQIAAVTDLPTLIDADTGFGEPMNVAACPNTTRGSVGTGRTRTSPCRSSTLWIIDPCSRTRE